MKEIFLGEVIRQRRLELGLTQEQLCEGICEPITISRMENGKQTPSRNRLNALLQRLGLPDDRYYALLSKNEMEISILEKEIVSYNIRFERASGDEKRHIREQALKKHQALESIIDQDDMLSKQLILRSKVLLGREDGPFSYEERISMLLDAIHLTSPDFDLEEIYNGLYTDSEIKIINQIAQTYILAGKHYSAIDVLKQLLRYIQKHCHKIPADRVHIPMITFNYARELETLGRYDEAIEIVELGRNVCINYGHYQFLPDLLAILAECYYHLGDSSKSMDLYCQSYYLYKAVGNNFDSAIIKTEAKEFLDLDLR